MMRPSTLAGGALLLAALLPCWLARGQSQKPAIADSGQRGQERALLLPDVPPRYADLDLPAHFRNRLMRRFDNTPAENPLTDAGALLGRVLFYDTRLSVNDTISCASCHQQKHAFADPRRFSKGCFGQQGDRNAMSLVNARFNPTGRFFWDERAASLEEQVLGPIQSKSEMGQDLNTLVKVLSGDTRYAELFRKAFGDSQVTSARIARALAQFVRSLVSCQSKYDEGLAKAGSVRDDFPNFTAQENDGKALFLRRCAVCHLPPGQAAVFYLGRPRNNGLDAGISVADVGVADVTFNRFQAGQFKSPELRNVEFTAPYMHDGRLATLEEVVEFYSSGVKAHPNLDPTLRQRRRMTESEKKSLVAFLKTLSDHKFLNDPRFLNPFAEQGKEPRP